MNNKSYLPALQILRAIAAVMVLYRHLWLEMARIFSIHSPGGDWLFRQGQYGVDFFFVLSGFIICYANYEKGGQPAYIKEYTLNRVLRIFIPYLPLTLLFLVIHSMDPHLSLASRDVRLLKSLTLLPVPGATALSVAWTLVFEMAFYGIFITYLISKRLFWGVCALWVICILLGVLLNCPISNNFPLIIAQPENLEFLAGVGLAVLVKHGMTPQASRKWIIGLALGALVLWLSPSFIRDKLYFSLLFACIILVALHTRLNTVSPKNLWMVLGNASYSIYLIHGPLISLIVRFMPRIGNELYIITCFLVIGILCCACGILYSKIFEQYLMTRARNFAKGLFLPASIHTYPSA